MLINKPATGGASRKRQLRRHLLNGVAWHFQQTNPGISQDSLPRYGLVHRSIKHQRPARTGQDRTGDASPGQTILRSYHPPPVPGPGLGDVKQDEGTIIAHVGRHLRFRKMFDAYPGRRPRQGRDDALQSTRTIWL